MEAPAAAVPVTVVTVVMCAAVLLMLVVSGPVADSISNKLGVGETGLLVWNIAKWPVVIVVVVLIVALLYYATPNVNSRASAGSRWARSSRS